MSSSDFFRPSAFSCTIEEIHQDLESSGFGSLLVKVTAGRVSATFAFCVSASSLGELLKTIDTVKEASAKLNASENPIFGPSFVGRGCVVGSEEGEEEGANVNQNDET